MHMTVSRDDLVSLKREELIDLAKKMGVKGAYRKRKSELIEELMAIFEKQASAFQEKKERAQEPLPPASSSSPEVSPPSAASPSPPTPPTAPSVPSGQTAPSPTPPPSQPTPSTDRPSPPTPAPAAKEPPKYAGRTFNFDNIISVEGVLDTTTTKEAYGFLRSSDYDYKSSPDDVYVPAYLVRKYGLKEGDTIWGRVKPPREGDKFFALTHIERINGQLPEIVRDRVAFEHLTPLFPREKFNLSADPNALGARIIDLFAPIGKGQRGLIVSPPKAGKTMLLKEVANVISKAHPEVYLIILLIDERPEEVTDMRRSVHAEVVASTFDEPAKQHVKVAEIVLEKAKRLVEVGHDVVILLDSITRLARAYNTVAPASGKILTGGVDSYALQRPKRFFGAARNIEGGGSLTIVATTLVDTGSKMDEVIFEEFKGTGNMELVLDRNLANKRIFPALNVLLSGTRREDLLIRREKLQKIWMIRRAMADMRPEEALNYILERLKHTRSNDEFLMIDSLSSTTY